MFDKTIAAAAVLAWATIAAVPAQAQDYVIGQYSVGDTVEANNGSGPWLVCTIVKHNEKQEDYEVSCPARPADTFRAGDNPQHIRPRQAGSDALTGGVAAPVRRPATSGNYQMAPRGPASSAPPRMGPAPARSGSNVLLGRWRLSDGECHTQIMEFLPTISRDYDMAVATSPAAWTQREVKYILMSTNEIFVQAVVGGHWGKYKIIDGNHMVPDSMFQCTYTRI